MQKNLPFSTAFAPAIQLLDTNNVAVKQWTGLSGNTGYMTKGGDVWRSVVANDASLMGGGICGTTTTIQS